MELHSQDKYEPKWPIAPKEVMLLCLILSQCLPGIIDQCLCNLATKCFFFYKRIDQTLNFDWVEDFKQGLDPKVVYGCQS